MTRAIAAGLAGLVAAALAGCIVAPYPRQTADYAQAESPPPDSPPQTYETADQAEEPPPPLPVYEQPPCPEEGYIWTPGVWRFGPEGYFWVPGTWVAPPQPGLLWTPGFWAFTGVVYVFHPGYWGPHVGYYGGIAYGGGYPGSGFVGGRWRDNRFEYNTAVTNVNVTNIHNTYNETVINNVSVRNTSVPRPSYARAPGAGRVPPTRAQVSFAREPRTAPTAPQVEHHQIAQNNPLLNAARNEGRPPIAATPRPTAFSARGVTAAKPVGPAYHPPPRRERPQRPRPGEHPN